MKQTRERARGIIAYTSSLLLTHYLLSLSSISYITCVDWTLLNREIDGIIVLITLPPNQWLGVLKMFKCKERPFYRHSL